MRRLIALCVSIILALSQAAPICIAAADEIKTQSALAADTVETEKVSEPKTEENNNTEVSVSEEKIDTDTQQTDIDTQQQTDTDTVESGTNEDTELTAANDGKLTPIFDFDSYDWSDPAEELNQKAREKYESTWKNAYPSRADIIKAEVDEGVFPTDEVFFGVWDESKDDFVNKPKLNYDFVSYYGYDLSAVKDAVKAGDYELAKEELLTYYRRVTEARGVETPSVTNSTTIMSDLLTQNFHVNSNWGLTAMFNMGMDEQEISIDVKDTVEKYREGTASLIIHAVHKDDYEAEFYSREADNGAHAPYIEVQIGGGKVIVPVSADGYVSGGSGKNDTSGGTSDRMYAREAGLDVAKDGYLTTDDTRRTYLLFDFSKYLQSGEITSATLKLYGKVNDKAEEKRNNPNYSKLMMIADNSTTWTEQNLCFSNQELKTYAYSMQSNESIADGAMKTAFWGMPNSDCNPNVRQDQELLRFGTWWDIMAKQYYATGNEDYARCCMLYLHDFIKSTFLIERGEEGTFGRWSTKQTNAPNGKLLFGGYSVTLDASARASGIAKNFHYIMNSEYLTPEIFTTFLKYFRKMGEHMVDDIWGGSENGGNWGTAQTNGHFAIMAYFPEIADMEEWSEAISKHLMASTSNTVNSDGSSHELSHSYTSYALGTQLSIKTMAEDMHLEFDYSDELKERILSLTKYMMRMALPGGYDPQYGDAGSYTRSYVEERFEFVGDWQEDPELLWMAHDGDEGEEPQYTSYYYPYGKTLAMRTGWGKNDLFLHTTADAATGTHSHWDDGGIVVSAYGNYLLSDQGYNGYLVDNIPHRWLVSSRGHNTVEINDYNQNSSTPNNMDSSLNKGSGAKGNFENVTFNDTYDFTKVDLTSVYKNLTYHSDPVIAPSAGDGTTPPVEKGMEYKRNILFIKPNFWIVSDYMNPVDQEKNNKYSQYWHMIPSANISIDGQHVLEEGETIEWRHSSLDQIDDQIKYTEFERGTGTGAFKSNFEGQANIQVVPADIDSVEPKLCYGYYENSGSTPYGRFDKYAVGTTGFDTILFPTKPGESYKITPEPLDISGYNTDNNQGAASAFTAEIKAEKAASPEDYVINYFIMHEPEKKDENADMTFGEYKTDGDLAYYEYNTKTNGPRRVIMQNATHVSASGQDYELVKSLEKVSDVTVEWNGSSLIIEGRKNAYEYPSTNFDYNSGDVPEISEEDKLDLTKLTIYAPYKLSSVTYNGEKVAFKQDKNYVYFGSDPILDGSNIFPPSDAGNSGENDSGGGNSGGGNVHGGSGGGNSSGGSSGGLQPSPSPTAKPSDKFANELNGHWGKDEISDLIDKGIVQGSDGSLKLKDNITRAEFTAMILRAADIEEKPYSGCFDDVSGSEWYAQYIQAAYDAGIMEGDGNTVRPNDVVTREEAVKILLKAIESKKTVEYTSGNSSFTDSESISEWAKEFVDTAVSLGLINGMEDNTFRPHDNLLREQAMVMVYRMLSVIEE